MATNGIEMKLMVTHWERSKAFQMLQVTNYIHFVQVTMILKVL